MLGHVLNTPGSRRMKTTRYFVEQVLPKRPYLPTEQFAAVPAAPLRRSAQSDGRIRYCGRVIDYPETDSLYNELTAEPGAEVREVVDGLNVDLDAVGNVVGIDIDQASTRLDLSMLEMAALPPKTTRAA